MAESNEPRPDESTPETPEGAISRHGDEQTPDGKPAHPSIKFEPRDVPFRWVLVVSIVFFCIGAVIFSLVYAFFRVDTARLASRRESEFPLGEHPSNALPAEPRLEEVDRLAGIERENVYLRLAAKEDQLSLYGETKEKGFVQIPIRRAMETLAGHLPVRKEQPAATKDNGLVDSGASNSGRMFRGASR
jgi:hypothetical protein